MAGGTPEAPSWLTNPPAGGQLPASGAAWPAQQENYGDVSVDGGPGLAAAHPWPAQQENYGGVSIASPYVPLAGPTVGN